MKEEWFVQEMLNWHPKLDWDQDELDQLVPELKALCKLNRGTIIESNHTLSEEVVKKYTINRLYQILDVLAFLFVKNLIGTELPQKFLKKTEAFTPELDILTPLAFTEMLNINQATHQQLVDLPGIGKVTATRILEYRKEKRRIRDLYELISIKGLSKKEVNKLNGILYVGDKRKGIQITSTALSLLATDPTFTNLINFWIKSDINFSRYTQNDELNIKSHIIEELSYLVEDLKYSKNRPDKFNLGVPSKYVETYVMQSEQAVSLNKNSIVNAHGTLLEDAEYPFFVLNLVRKATSKIRIIMFFMRYEDEDRYPTDDLFDELRKAKNRGVDVKIILDQDAEGDAINSRTINDEAYKFFENNNIPVKFDSVETYTHSKIVVIDNSHLIIGSHNWTAGSFFAYDDTSVYIHSDDLSQYYFALFEDLWAKY